MAAVRGAGKYGKPNYDQAKRIVRKFGGEPALAQLLGISRITPYRWQMARPLGTDGLVPQKMRPRIEAIARYQGVLLLPADWEATRIHYDDKPEVIRAAAHTLPSLDDLLT